MVTLPTVQPANVFGSYIGGRQARQSEDMNALRIQGAQQQQQMQALTALAAVYKKASTPEEFQSGVRALQGMGFLNPGETIEYDEGMRLLSEVFGPQADAWGNMKIAGGHVLRPNGAGGVESVWSPPEKPDPWGDARTVGGRIVAPDGQGGVREVYAAPEEAPKAPSGYAWGEGGRLVPIPGGPADKPEKDPLATLKARAAEAGLEPGSEQYRQFMLDGGRDMGLAIDVDPATGGVSFRQGSGAGSAPKPFTEGQSKDVVYATRARGALEVLDPLAGELASFGSRAANADPTGVVRGRVQSPDFQIAQNAGNEFLQAILRKDTGAAITEQEQALYGQTYLPQPGDGPDVIAEKARARRRAIAAIEAGMSPTQMIAQERGIRAGAGGSDPARERVQSMTDEELMRALGVQ